MSAEILAADARRTQAMVDANLDTLRTLIADDCRYVHSTSGVDTKASYLDKLSQGVFRYRFLRTLEQHLIPLDGGLIISHRMEAGIIMNGVERPYASQAVAVWRTGATGPQLVYFQATSLPAAPQP